MSEYTPGPWTVNKDGTQVRTVERHDGHWVWVASMVGGATRAEREANARLIAAAPELLEALRQAHNSLSEAQYELGGQRGVEARAQYAIEAAQAAITKAETLPPSKP